MGESGAKDSILGWHRADPGVLFLHCEFLL
jgi:hypothetical protein